MFVESGCLERVGVSIPEYLHFYFLKYRRIVNHITARSRNSGLLSYFSSKNSSGWSAYSADDKPAIIVFKNSKVSHHKTYSLINEG